MVLDYCELQQGGNGSIFAVFGMVQAFLCVRSAAFMSHIISFHYLIFVIYWKGQRVW